MLACRPQPSKARIDHIETEVVMKNQGLDVSHYAYELARMPLGSLNLAFLALRLSIGGCCLDFLESRIVG